MKHSKKARGPFVQLEATLDKACYTSDAWFAREADELFAREWCCVARAPELPNAGDYRLIALFGESLLLVRGDDGSLRGFFNVCRHRGSRLVSTDNGDEICGHFRGGIRCPYHSWHYRLDGSLRATPHLNVDRTGLSLHTVQVGEWGGFIFACLGKPRVDLATSLAEISARVCRYPLARLRVARRAVYKVHANWKVLLENYNECYHCAGVHPELCEIVPAFRRGGGQNLDWDRGVAHRDGANTFTFSGTTSRAAFEGLNEDEQSRHKGELVFPNLMLSLAMDHVAAFMLMPRSATRTDVFVYYLFEPGEMSRADFNPDDAVEFWHLTNRQDWRICESVQSGMGSRVFQSGYYAPMEDLSLDVRDYLRQRMTGLPGEEPPR